MSTSTAAPGHESAAPARPKYATALRGELALNRRRLVTWISIGVWAFSVAVFAYLVSYASTVGAEWYTPEQQRTIVASMLPSATSYYVLASLPLYAAAQFAILGAILGASDHARGTIRTIMSRFPRRTSFIAARLTGLIVLAAITAIVTMLVSVLSSIGVALVHGGDMAFPALADLAVTTLAIWLAAIAFIAIGFALGTLTRSVIAGVAIAVGWMLGVESLLIGMLAPVAPALGALQGYLPTGATSSLAAAFVPAEQQTVPALAAATTPGVAIAVLLGWTLLAGAVSWALLRRRDLA